MEQERMDREAWFELRTAGWRESSARWVTGIVLFLTASGLAIWALPFSAFNQHAVIVHTVVSVLFTLPLVVYSVRHVKRYWDFPLAFSKVSGWASGAALLVCALSGWVLTIDGALGTRISYVWRTTHIVSTFAVIVLVGAHLVPLALRELRSATHPETAAAVRGHTRFAGLATAVLFFATAALTAFVRAPSWNNDFPQNYERAPYGDAGPFAPSLATTANGGCFDARSLSNSASCGTSRCHEEIYQEWLPSAHRYSSLDPAFQAIQSVMATQNGPTSTRYCGGCHDAVSLFSGTKNIGVENLSSLAGYQEGVSCLVCHSIKQTDVKGNASYVMSQPDRYVWESRDGALSKFLADFLIRSYPAHHVATLSKRMFKTPEYCAACHKQFIDEKVNNVGWVQLQNQYDQWKASRWNTEGVPEKTIECRECHMPLVASHDPASGDSADFNRTPDDGKHRSHRFLGANQFIPKLTKLDHADEQCALVEKWLRGEVEVPEIDARWRKGPAITVEIESPDSITAGSKADVRVHVANNKAGHDFPTGPLDIIQAWVEVAVSDASGREVFHSGARDASNFVATGTFMFKAEPVDRYGNLIDRHNLWEMVGVRFRRSLFPGAEDVASYQFGCPGVDSPKDPSSDRDQHVSIPIPEDAAGDLHVVAKLEYRKFDQYLLNYVFGEKSGLTAPVTVMSSATKSIHVTSGTR